MSVENAFSGQFLDFTDYLDLELDLRFISSENSKFYIIEMSLSIVILL